MYSGKPSSQSSGDAGATSGFSSSHSQYSPGEYSSSNLLCNNTTSTILSIVGGAALGGVIMYLLDPEEGPSRRRYVGDLAGGTWETIRDTAGSAYEAVRDGAVGLGAATATGASALGRGVAGRTGRIGRGVANTRVAKSIGRGTRNFRNETSDRMRYLARGNQRTDYIESGTGEALTAIGMLALGAGAMYLLDNRDGARRRTVLRDRFLSGFGRMCTSLDRLGRDAWHRASGTVHELKARRGEEFVDDSTIVERVRANVGHCVSSNLNTVDVTCINGRVTLRGSIPAHEVDDLLKCASSTRGVKEIVNQLNTGGNADAGATGFSTERVTPTPAPAAMGSTITCPNPT